MGNKIEGVKKKAEEVKRKVFNYNLNRLKVGSTKIRIKNIKDQSLIYCDLVLYSTKSRKERIFWKEVKEKLKYD